MVDLKGNFRIYYTHFDKEELLHTFSLGMLQEMYRFYCDPDVKDEDIPKTSYELAKFLDLKVKKRYVSHALLENGDLVRNMEDTIFRVKEVNHFDARLGNLPLVYDIVERTTFSHIGHLIKVEEVEFSEFVSIANKIKLASMMTRFNFVQVGEELYKVGELYVVDDTTAVNLLHAKMYWNPHKVNR